MNRILTISACSIILILLFGFAWYQKSYLPAQEVKQKIDTAKSAVADQLLDPSSAQFKNVLLLSEALVCGEVNAKNRMGGYVGFTAFSVIGGDFVTVDSDDSQVAKMQCDQHEAKK